jgi:transcriptional regulator with XRE-family HTH domain
MATSFGQWLKEQLERRGLSQRQLALAVNKTPSHISQVINDRGGLSPDLVNEIADVLEVPRKAALQAWIDSQSGEGEELTREPVDPDLARINELWRDGKISERDKKVMLLLAAQNEEDERQDSIGKTPSN